MVRTQAPRTACSWVAGLAGGVFELRPGRLTRRLSARARMAIAAVGLILPVRYSWSSQPASWLGFS